MTAKKHFGRGKKECWHRYREHQDTQNGFLETRALGHVKTAGLTRQPVWPVFPQLARFSCVLSDWKVFATDWQVWQTPAGQLFVTETERRVHLSVNSEHLSVNSRRLNCVPELLTSQQLMCAGGRRFSQVLGTSPCLLASSAEIPECLEAGPTQGIAKQTF